MIHRTGPGIDIPSFKLGDSVVDTENKPVDAVLIDAGYMIPPEPKSLHGSYFYVLHKENVVMGDRQKIYLSKEEIIALYEYMKKKEGL